MVCVYHKDTTVIAPHPYMHARSHGQTRGKAPHYGRGDVCLL